MPGDAGRAHRQRPDLTLNDGTKSKTFEIILKNSTTTLTPGDTDIYVNSTDTPTDIVNEIDKAISGAGLKVNVYTDTVAGSRGNREHGLPGTLKITLGAAPNGGDALTLEGDGPDNGGQATVSGKAIASDNYTIIPVNFSMTAAQVADEVAVVMDATMDVTGANATSQAVLLDPTQTALIHMVDHNVVRHQLRPAALRLRACRDQAPVRAIIASPVAHGQPAPRLLHRRRDRRLHRRGEMVTAATPDTNFDALPVPPGLVTSGSYELTIQRGTQYGTYNPPAPSRRCSSTSRSTRTTA